ncbi:hypothetical protein ACFW96_09190 [Streptomyces gardneri]|uniref:hypothetical protein n=1 Tax=Streptomyces gardneri TaxID=66892 RepID=UPI00367E4C53
MPERTQLTQEDEALRRARLDKHARAVLLDIAHDLTDVKPWQRAARQVRSKQPLATAVRLNGRGPYADNVAEAAKALMPTITEDITRGEYALILRRAAGKVDA